MNKRVIRDYLESLKEDNEFDFIFPLLLENMGFEIISTPKNSKGQCQYGKDVIAVGPDEEGKKFKWYFELKGNAAKDINDRTFSMSDGVRESILAAKYAAYDDASIPTLSTLDIKIVYVHPGRLQENFRLVFDGFINTEFPYGGFERWDIEKLVNLFNKFMFDECLFRDEKSYRLVKKILVQYDAPGWSTTDLDTLIEHLLANCSGTSMCSRVFDSTISALALLNTIIYNECKTADNVLPVKQTIDRTILLLWAWILEHRKETNKQVLRKFSQVLGLQFDIYSRYFNKLLPLALEYKGLYVPKGCSTEKICYPLRCYNFVNDFIYFVYASAMVFKMCENGPLIKTMVHTLFAVISSNPGITMPLLDTHYMTFQLLYKLINDYANDDQQILKQYKELLTTTTQNIYLRKLQEDMLPELYSNQIELGKSIYQKSEGYKDSSSIFILRFMELLAHLNLKDSYLLLRNLVEENKCSVLDIQFKESDCLEVRLFRECLSSEIAIKPVNQLPASICEFKESYRKATQSIKLRTWETPFSFLPILAHLHYRTDWFPDFIDLGNRVQD